MQTLCDYCGCKLRPFRTKTDWSQRNMHKICYKKQQQDLQLKYTLDAFLFSLNSGGNNN